MAAIQGEMFKKFLNYSGFKLLPKATGLQPGGDNRAVAPKN